MKRKIFAGTTSLSLSVVVYDNTSTTGAGLNGLTHSTSGLVLEYRRAGQSSWTSVALVSKTLGTYTSGGIVADGSRTGRYEIDIPDAALASGVRMVLVCLRGAASMHPVDIEIELDAVNYQDATAFGLSKFADIETDTQNIQSRLPTALSGGRMDSSVGAYQSGLVPSNFAMLSIDGSGRVLLQPTQTGVTIPTVQTVELVNELGVDALNANSLQDDIASAVWSSLTTATWPTDSFGKQVLIGNSTQRAVAVTGSNHVAADIHEFQPGVITEADFADGALSARVLAADAATEIATAVGTLQVLTRLDSMIESDGAGQFRFDTIALSMAPAGGGGGGSTTVNVYPVSASTPERVAGTTLTFYRDESRAVSVVTDFTLTSLTLRFVVEDNDGNDALVIENGSITKSSQTFTVSITTAVTANLGNYRWSMRDITSGNSVIAFGVLTVQEAASKDA